MKKLALALSLALASAAASAATIGFDDVTAADGPYRLSNANPYRNLSWDNFSVVNGVTYVDRNGPSGYTNGVVSPNYVAFNAGTGDASFSAAEPFSLYSTWLTAGWRTDLQLDITGYLEGTVVASRTVTLSPYAPTEVTFGARWHLLDAVSFASYGGTEVADFNFDTETFVMDDIAVARVPVPATSTLALAGLGLIAMFRRRRSADEAAC